ncbi:putative flavin-containing monooxygenase 1, partial [Mucuna pruriens]
MATHDKHPNFVSKIAIIGAGVSGIAATKQLSHHNPIVFEASDSIGGVWRHCSYNSTKLQSHRRDYEFSDFPWPQRNNSEFPTHLEILDYLYSYARHFDVLKNIRINSKVVEIRYVGDQEHASNFGGQPNDHGTPLPGYPVWELAVTNQSDTVQYSSSILMIKIR